MWRNEKRTQCAKFIIRLQTWAELVGSWSHIRWTTLFSGKGQREETAVASVFITTVLSVILYNMWVIEGHCSQEAYSLFKETKHAHKQKSKQYKMCQMGNVSLLETAECLHITKTYIHLVGQKPHHDARLREIAPNANIIQFHSKSCKN